MTEPTKQPERDDRMSSEDYENLLDRYQYSTKEITMGKILKGRVIKKHPDPRPRRRRLQDRGRHPQRGVHGPGGPGGPEARRRGRHDAREDRPQGRLPRPVQEAGRRRSGPSRTWTRPSTHGLTVTGTVIERTRGGFNVDVGIPAFLPESHADIRPIRDAVRPHRADLQVPGHQVRPQDRERRPVAQARPPGRAREEEEARLRRPGQGPEGHGPGQVPDQLRRLRRHRRHRGPAPRLGHLLGQERPSVRASDRRPGGRGRRPRLQREGREDLPRPQAAHPRPLGQHRREVPGRAEDHRQGLQPDRFRRLRRAREGRRRPRPHLRPDLVAQARPPQEGPHPGPGGRRHHPRRQPDDQAHLPGPQAGLPPPARELPPEARHRLPGQGDRDEPDRLRRLRRGREGHRGARPHLRHQLGEDQAPLREAQGRPGGRDHRPQHRRRQAEGLPGHQAARGRHLGGFLHPPEDRRHRQGQDRPADGLRRLRRDHARASRASSSPPSSTRRRSRSPPTPSPSATSATPRSSR